MERMGPFRIASTLARKGAGEIRPRPPLAADNLDEVPTGEWPRPSPASREAGEEALRALLRIELEASPAGPKSGNRPSPAAELRRLRGLVARHGGIEVEKGEALLALFERPSAAVACALGYLRPRLALPDEDRPPSGRAAIHLGEVLLLRPTPEEVSHGARTLEVEGAARDTAARLAALARSGQILLGRGAFDLARRAGEVEAGGAEGESAAAPLRWLAHGSYSLEGLEEPLEIFEVGFAALSPFEAPAEGPGTRRRRSPSEERLLGWRPAGGQKVPQRPTWRLAERLGEGGFGEVWLARHESGEKKVFKFCFEADRLRALKREVTLFRLLKEALGHRDDIARILDWQFEEPPFFIESEYTEGGSLARWAEQSGGLANIALAVRLELAAQVAEALSAAHSVGILHKDVKPENVLVRQDRDGRPYACLTDFGIGLLTERERLAGGGLTALGFTATLAPGEAGGGTPGYLAPELAEGHPATVQADIYSLGVLLYQLAAGDFRRPLAPGWERDVGDPILAEDIAQFVDGQAERRPASAREVAERLRSLDRRRELRAAEAAARARAEKSERRKRQLAVVAATSTFFLVVVAVLAALALRSRAEARMQRHQAEGLVDFLLGDLHDSLEPLGRLDLLDRVAHTSLAYFEQSETEGSDALYKRALALMHIGDVLLDRADVAGAHQAFAEAEKRMADLVDRDAPSLAWRESLCRVRNRLGETWLRRGDPEAALTFHSSAERLAGELSAAGGLGEGAAAALFGETKMLLARTRYSRGEFEDSLAAAQAGLARVDPFVAGLEVSARFRLLEVDLRAAQGAALQSLGRPAETRAILEIARERLDLLMTAEPTNFIWLQRRTSVEFSLALAARKAEEDPEALAAFRNAHTGYERLMRLDPANDSWKAGAAQSQVEMGITLMNLGRLEEAEKSFDRSLGEMQALIEKDPRRFQWNVWLGKILRRKAELSLRRGRVAEAVEFSAASCAAIGRIASLDQTPLATRNNWAWCLLELGRTFEANGDREKAAEAWGKALAVIAPITKISRSCSHLDTHASILIDLKRIDEARFLVQSIVDQGCSYPKLAAMVRSTQVGE